MDDATLADWNDEMKAKLTELWPKFSGSQIACKLGELFDVCLSRNAVIGKANRMELEKKRLPAFCGENHPSWKGGAHVRDKDKRRENRLKNGWMPKPRPPVTPNREKAAAAPMVACNNTIVCCPGPVHVTERNMFTQCGWPLWGDQAEFSELMCCGNPSIDGLSYCRAHYKAGVRYSALKSLTWMTRVA